MKKKFILITGGARSGKTSFSEKLAQKLGKEFVYIATTIPLDKEMKDRVKKHKENRSKIWKVIEEPLNVISVFKKENKKGKVILLDCLTLLLNNWMMKKYNENSIEDKIKEMAKSCKNCESSVIIISNEVGLGIVPRNKLARLFRDRQGKSNQILAKYADEVYFMAAGLPMRLK
ncbi:MAG: bifunctional adenosylcobinamide kinase/adenosylcobinamide-phosphate guanylyltransferase [Candidatus Firestonebacteria bacterium]